MTSCRQSNSPVDADGADTIAPEPVKLLPPVDHLDSSQEKDIIIREKLASPETNAAVLSPRDATKEEIETLHHVVGKIPLTAWLVAFTGAASQFAYYGTTIPWRMFSKDALSPFLLIEYRELCAESRRESISPWSFGARTSQGHQHQLCLLVLHICDAYAICYCVRCVDRAV